MPQPIPKSVKKPEIKIGDAVNQRPILALQAAKVIQAWASLEHMMAVLFNRLIQGDPTATAAVFGAIKNATTQRDALIALANVALSSEEQKLILRAIIAIYGNASKRRNVVAHHMWGVLDEIPDAIIMVDPRKAASLNTAIAAHKINDTFTIDKGKELLERIVDAGRVWKNDDFLEIYDRIARTQFLVVTFSIMLPDVDRPTVDEKARQMLLDAPEIQEFLFRNASNQEN